LEQAEKISNDVMLEEARTEDDDRIYRILYVNNRGPSFLVMRCRSAEKSDK